MTNHICKNCGNAYQGNYCNNCGQPHHTHPIDAKFLMHDLQHGLMHINGGIFYSARELFKRPGHTIREYIEGKRIKHYMPVSMVIVMATFYGLFYHSLHINVFESRNDGALEYNEINDWIAHHYAIVTLLLIPIMSLSSYIVFKKSGYNFFEHLILNSFYSAQKLWLHLLVLPFFMLIDSKMILAVMQWLMLADALLMFWCYSQFFSNLPKLKAFLLTVLSYLLFTFLVVVSTTVIFTYLLEKH